jgi:hypothetical protein
MGAAMFDGFGFAKTAAFSRPGKLAISQREPLLAATLFAMFGVFGADETAAFSRRDKLAISQREIGIQNPELARGREITKNAPWRILSRGLSFPSPPT